MKALVNHKKLTAILPPDGGDSEQVLSQFPDARIDLDAQTAQLQEEGAKSFDKSWRELMSQIVSKRAAHRKAAR